MKIRMRNQINTKKSKRSVGYSANCLKIQGTLAMVLIFVTVCNAHPVQRHHLYKRHLTPIGSIIRNTASTLLNPLGLIRGGGSQSSSQSFSIGGNFLGFGGSLSTSSSRANAGAPGTNSVASSSAGSSAGGSSSQAHSSAASQERGFESLGGASDSAAQSFASSSNVRETNVQPINSGFARPIRGYNNVFSELPIAGTGGGEVIGYELTPIIASKPPGFPGQNKEKGFFNSYPNSQTTGYAGSYNDQRNTGYPRQTLQKPSAIIIIEEEGYDNQRNNYPGTGYVAKNTEGHRGTQWSNVGYQGSHGVPGLALGTPGSNTKFHGSGSQTTSFSHTNTQGFQSGKGAEFEIYGPIKNFGSGDSLGCGNRCTRPVSGGNSFESGFGVSSSSSSAQSQSSASNKVQVNPDSLDSAIEEVFGVKNAGPIGGVTNSHSSGQSSNFGGFNESGSHSFSSSRSGAGLSSSSSQSSSYSKSDSLIFN